MHAKIYVVIILIDVKPKPRFLVAANCTREAEDIVIKYWKKYSSTEDCSTFCKKLGIITTAPESVCGIYDERTL